MPRFMLPLILALLTLVAACSGGSTPPPGGSDPEISGKIAVVGAAPASLEGMAFAGEAKGSYQEIHVDTSLGTSQGKPLLVPGELIVKFRDGGLATQAQGRLVALGHTLERVAPAALGTDLYRSAGLSDRETLELARTLSARPDIEYAVPNTLKYASAIPDDTYYHLQWHYPAIRMPEVWDIIQGSNVVVAVVDSGILYTQGVPAGSHPDFFGKVLPGYDFVSDPRNAGDGDGLDPDPFDLDFQISHGAHVAGTIAAATNNNRDVAGINWDAMILPVRVMGVNGSGSTLDIMQGALWAAGGSVPGVPNNPTPAQVINMSLGGRSICTPYHQDIFQQIFSLGAIVVVAAGNENDDANRYAPGNCPGVITVGATDARGDRAPYSNYGPRIDIMAPGGNTGADTNNDGFVDGVLSLGVNPQSGEFTLSFKQGTSMAAPHVAGVISLMKGINPALTAAEALAILRSTANPLTPASCQRSTGRDCGAGLMNALAAVRAVGQPSAPATAGQVVAFNPDPVDFGATRDEIALTLTNVSNAPVTYGVTDVNWLPTNPSDFVPGLLGGDPTSGTLPAGGSVTMTLWVDRSVLTADGNYAFEYKFLINGREQLLLGRFSHGVSSGLPTGQTFVVSFLMDENDQLRLDENDQFIVGGAKLYPSFVPEYAMVAVPGRHLVIAWVDENGSEEIDDGDYVGVYQDGVLVSETRGQGGVDVPVARSVGIEAVEGRADQLLEAVEQARHARP